MHQTTAELEAALAHIRAAPADIGTLELIVRRPAVDEREVMDTGILDPAHGLVGDIWKVRGSKHTPDGSSEVIAQLNVMNARMAAALTPHDLGRRALAGDQLYLDLDLSVDNLPAGTRLAIGDAVIEVTAKPHLGCDKFVARFGREAMQFVNGELGRQLRLRGLNAMVVQAGAIQRGDVVRKLSST